MGPFGIVLHKPGIHRLAHLRQVTKRIGIQYLPAKCAVEPLNISILSWLARLDPVQDYLLIGAPILQSLTNELWSIVTA